MEAAFAPCGRGTWTTQCELLFIGPRAIGVTPLLRETVGDRRQQLSDDEFTRANIISAPACALSEPVADVDVAGITLSKEQLKVARELG